MSDDFLDGIEPKSISEVETAASRVILEAQGGIAYELTLIVPEAAAMRFVNMVDDAVEHADPTAMLLVLDFALFVREQIEAAMEEEESEGDW